MSDKQFYTTTEVADQAGVSRDTLMRWLKTGKIPEPDRDRNLHRSFTREELDQVVRYANTRHPSPIRQRESLPPKPTRL